jgi:hypothetical protein
MMGGPGSIPRSLLLGIFILINCSVKTAYFSRKKAGANKTVVGLFQNQSDFGTNPA